jgi:ADP-heptose:LPS heptosyltransferase
MPDTVIKRLELAVRGWYNARVGRLGEPIVIGAPHESIRRTDIRRVLLLRQDRIGDVIVSTPIIRALRRHMPDARIDMVLSTNNVAVRQAVEPYIDRIHVFRKSLLHLLLLRRTLRRQRYDLVIDLMDNASSTSALLVSGAHAPFAIGIDKVNRGVYTHVVPLADQSRVHIVERIARLTWPLGISIEGEDLRLSFPLSNEQRSAAQIALARGRSERILAVNISGSDTHRMYPEEKMIDALRQICDWCHSRSLTDVGLRILSAPAHHEMAQRIGKACGASVIVPQKSYGAFSACIAESDMLLTPDTSAVHVAAAHSIPSVVLFSQDARGLLPWTPYAAPCWPCITDSGALEAIESSEVVHAVQQMLMQTTVRNEHDA